MTANQVSPTVLDVFLKQVESYGNKFDFSGDKLDSSQEATMALPVLWRMASQVWETLDDKTKARASKAFEKASAKVFPKSPGMYARFAEASVLSDS